MTDSELQQLSHKIITEITGKNKITVLATFYDTRSLNHKIKIENGKIHIRIAKPLSSAPYTILHTLVLILVLKLYRYKVDRRLYKAYREYLKDNSHLLPQTQHRPPNPRYTAKGAYFNLNEVFDRINRIYFQDQLERPVLGWSLRKAYRRLGFYNKDKNLLVISRIFDSRKTPAYVVEYLMYHEMLHIAIPTVHDNGRRKIHSATFRQKERQFPDYDRVQKWLTKNLKKL